MAAYRFSESIQKNMMTLHLFDDESNTTRERHWQWLDRLQNPNTNNRTQVQQHVGVVSQNDIHKEKLIFECRQLKLKLVQLEDLKHSLYDECRKQKGLSNEQYLKNTNLKNELDSIKQDTKKFLIKNKVMKEKLEKCYTEIRIKENLLTTAKETENDYQMKIEKLTDEAKIKLEGMESQLISYQKESEIHLKRSMKDKEIQMTQIKFEYEQIIFSFEEEFKSFECMEKFIEQILDFNHACISTNYNRDHCSNLNLIGQQKFYELHFENKKLREINTSVMEQIKKYRKQNRKFFVIRNKYLKDLESRQEVNDNIAKTNRKTLHDKNKSKHATDEYQATQESCDQNLEEKLRMLEMLLQEKENYISLLKTMMKKNEEQLAIRNGSKEKTMTTNKQHSIGTDTIVCTMENSKQNIHKENKEIVMIEEEKKNCKNRPSGKTFQHKISQTPTINIIEKSDQSTQSQLENLALLIQEMNKKKITENEESNQKENLKNKIKLHTKSTQSDALSIIERSDQSIQCHIELLTKTNTSDASSQTMFHKIQQQNTSTQVSFENQIPSRTDASNNGLIKFDKQNLTNKPNMTKSIQTDTISQNDFCVQVSFEIQGNNKKCDLSKNKSLQTQTDETCILKNEEHFQSTEDQKLLYIKVKEMEAEINKLNKTNEKLRQQVIINQKEHSDQISKIEQLKENNEKRSNKEIETLKLQIQYHCNNIETKETTVEELKTKIFQLTEGNKDLANELTTAQKQHKIEIENICENAENAEEILKKEMENLKEKVQELEKTLESKETKLSNLGNENTEITKQAKDLLQKEMENSKEKVQELEKMLETKEIKLSNLCNENADVIKQATLMKKQIDQLESEKLSLENEKQSTMNTNKKLIELTDEYKQLKKICDSINEQKSIAEKNNFTMKEEIAKMKLSMQDQKNITESLEEEITELNDKNKSLISSKQKCEARDQENTNCIAVLQDQLKRLENENQQLIEEKNNNNNNENIGNYNQDEVNKLTKELNEKDNELYKQKIKISNLEDDKEIAKEKIEELKASIDQQKNSITETYKNESDKLKKRLQNMQNDLNERDDEYMALKQKMTNLKKTLYDVNSNNEELACRLDEKEEMIDAMRTGEQCAQQSVAEYKKEIKQLNNIIEDLQSAMQAIENDMGERTKKFTEEIDEKDNTIQTLQQKLNNQQNQSPTKQTIGQQQPLNKHRGRLGLPDRKITFDDVPKERESNKRNVGHHDESVSVNDTAPTDDNIDEIKRDDSWEDIENRLIPKVNPTPCSTTNQQKTEQKRVVPMKLPDNRLNPNNVPVKANISTIPPLGNVGLQQGGKLPFVPTIHSLQQQFMGSNSQDEVNEEGDDKPMPRLPMGGRLAPLAPLKIKNKKNKKSKK